MQARYDREQRYMLSVVSRFGEQRVKEHLALQGQQQKFGPTSWLAQQRKNVRPFIYASRFLLILLMRRLKMEQLLPGR